MLLEVARKMRILAEKAQEIQQTTQEELDITLVDPHQGRYQNYFNENQIDLSNLEQLICKKHY